MSSGALKSPRSQNRKEINSMDIFNLYRREQTIVHETPEGEKITLIIAKPTRGDKEKIFKEMNKSRDEAEKEVKENPALSKSIEDITKAYSRDEQVNVILNNEEAQQMQSSDLFPIGDRATMTEEQIDMSEKEFALKWREKRKVQLEELSDDEIFTKTKNIFIESNGLIAAGEMYAKQILLYCVFDEQHNRIFKSIDDIGKLDDIMFNWLRSEMDKFSEMLTQKDIRKAVQNNAFLSSTESVKNTTGSTVITP
jgi:hypothetical protein